MPEVFSHKLRNCEIFCPCRKDRQFAAWFEWVNPGRGQNTEFKLLGKPWENVGCFWMAADRCNCCLYCECGFVKEVVKRRGKRLPRLNAHNRHVFRDDRGN